jgi:hypothetical protein
MCTILFAHTSSHNFGSLDPVLVTVPVSGQICVHIKQHNMSVSVQCKNRVVTTASIFSRFDLGDDNRKTHFA